MDSGNLMLVCPDKFFAKGLGLPFGTPRTFVEEIEISYIRTILTYITYSCQGIYEY